MRKFLFFEAIFFSFIFLSLSGGENIAVPRTIRELPENTSYIHGASSLRFPPVIASYKKISVTENANPVYGTVIRYSGSYGESADIYIYSDDTSSSPIEEKKLKEEYEKTKSALLKGFSNFSGSNHTPPAKEEIKFLKEEKIQSSGITSEIYKSSFQYFLAGSRYDSTLLLFLIKNPAKKSDRKKTFAKFLKIRLSRPSEVSSGSADEEKFLKELLEKVIFHPALSSAGKNAPAK